MTNGTVKISYKISRLPSPCLPWSCSSQNHATFFLFTSTATEKDSLVAVDFVQVHIVLVVICIKVSRKSISLTKTDSTAVELFISSLSSAASQRQSLINIFFLLNIIPLDKFLFYTFWSLLLSIANTFCIVLLLPSCVE